MSNYKNNNKNKKYRLSFNNIKVSKHAIDQYRTRIYEYATDDEIEKFFNMAINKGYVKSIRDSILESGQNKTEIRFIFCNYGILGVYEEGLLTVVTCTGDRIQRGWYRKEELGKPYKMI